MTSEAKLLRITVVYNNQVIRLACRRLVQDAPGEDTRIRAYLPRYRAAPYAAILPTEKALAAPKNLAGAVTFTADNI